MLEIINTIVPVTKWDVVSGQNPFRDIARAKKEMYEKAEIDPSLLVINDEVAGILLRWMMAVGYNADMDNKQLSLAVALNIQVLIIPMEFISAIIMPLDYKVWLMNGDKVVQIKDVLV